MASSSRAAKVPNIRDKVDSDTLQGLLRWKGDRIIGDELNILSVLELHPALRTLVQFDEFAHEMQTAGPAPWDPAGTSGRTWADADTLELQRWLLQEKFDIGRGPGRGVIEACLDRHARRRMVHPVREYLSGLRHDGEKRLDSWLEDYMGAIGPTHYLRVVGRRYLMQAVARIFSPACQADHTIVLESPQGAGKSTALKRLAKNPNWFTDSMPPLGTKDSMIQLRGKWIIELAELTAMRKSDVESVKAFLTRPVDVYRPHYGRRTVQFPRHCVFAATTNEHSYLQDRTGNRRFWPVRCGYIDRSALEEACDQLWAEAVVAFKAGEPWHLTGDEVEAAEDQQASRVYVSELEERVIAYLEEREASGVIEVYAADVMRSAAGFDPTSDLVKAGQIGPVVYQILSRRRYQRGKPIGYGSARRVPYRKMDPS